MGLCPEWRKDVFIFRWSFWIRAVEVPAQIAAPVCGIPGVNQLNPGVICGIIGYSKAAAIANSHPKGTPPLHLLGDGFYVCIPSVLRTVGYILIYYMYIFKLCFTISTGWGIFAFMPQIMPLHVSFLLPITLLIWKSSAVWYLLSQLHLLINLQ